MKNFKNLYKKFIEKKTHTYFENNLQNIEMDCFAGWVEGYYIIATQIQWSKLRIIIGNIDEKIKEWSVYAYGKNGYLELVKNEFNDLPKQLKEIFISRGITKPDADNRLSTRCIHRIIAGLKYENIEGLDVHHLDKNKENNKVDNLLPVPREMHISIHFNGCHITPKQLHEINKINNSRNKLIRKSKISNKILFDLLEKYFIFKISYSAIHKTLDISKGTISNYIQKYCQFSEFYQAIKQEPDFKK